MPGLLNQITGAALPLTASDVTSFVSGYALGLTASLTYGNLEAQPFQGKDSCWGFPGATHPHPRIPTPTWTADIGQVL